MAKKATAPKFPLFATQAQKDAFNAAPARHAQKAANGALYAAANPDKGCTENRKAWAVWCLKTVLNQVEGIKAVPNPQPKSAAAPKVIPADMTAGDIASTMAALSAQLEELKTAAAALKMDAGSKPKRATRAKRQTAAQKTENQQAKMSL